MGTLAEKIALYWAFPFVKNAFLVGVLVALCASVLGVTLVLKRFSLIGDGLSHVAFGAMSVASVMNLTNNMPLVLGVTALSAVLLLRAARGAELRGDAAMAMLSVGALAVGYLVVNLFSGSANLTGDVCATLFGSTSILTLTRTDVWTCVVLSAAVLLLYLLLYHKVFAVTFDPDFAGAAGLRTKVCDLVLAVATAVIIVMAMRLVGSLLITALVVFPTLSAMRLFGSFRGVSVCAAALGAGSAAVGIALSVLAGTPVGATIVAVQMLLFFLFVFLGRIGGR